MLWVEMFCKLFFFCTLNGQSNWLVVAVSILVVVAPSTPADLKIKVIKIAQKNPICDPQQHL